MTQAYVFLHYFLSLEAPDRKLQSAAWFLSYFMACWLDENPLALRQKDMPTSMSALFCLQARKFLYQ